MALAEDLAPSMKFRNCHNYLHLEKDQMERTLALHHFQEKRKKEVEVFFNIPSIRTYKRHALRGPESPATEDKIALEVGILKTELEASQRQLESKEEALKILQSMAIFGKATSHTQAVLQKTMEQKRFLEKEINALQWEIEFDQNRFKNIEESWTQKYDSFFGLAKSVTLSNALDLKLAVLGACLCHGPGGSPCSCAKMAASTRKLLLQLKQELELLQKSKEEAYLMADAFRIAFEQQLMRKNDQALRLTQVDKMCKKATKWINWKHLKEDGCPPQKSKKTLGQKLLGILPSENTSKEMEDQDNPQDVFKMLIDLLNDKEEALAHQRKVSYMLAQALEDKDAASKENEEKNAMKENSPFKNPWHKTSEFSVLHDPLNSSVQIFNSAGYICSIPRSQADPNYTRTLKRSHSLPSSITF
ncbi:coiled-coil domain-containing protein 125 [Otolemur garnettii]|uniref:coiled-coil domain-containing protein 125 n=1 Tax=Otolemur garnettii TaxID=30611 RepID=UPI000C7F10AB|nr:coiled-coil domain-containing protein 125 [Otolemur garnettii]